jgi:MinD superfamily P-loop ATPase
MNEIAILSGKGGTGKTSLSAAFATLDGHKVLADCDVEAANLYLILQSENRKEQRFLTGHKAVIDYEMCNQCGLCMTYCRFGAISADNGRVVIVETACDGCMLCEKICPVRAITLVPRNRLSGNFFGNRGEKGDHCYRALPFGFS